jgi:MOSC domain-containing protein YiiM
MHLDSIQIGLPQTYGDPEATALNERAWETGFYKETVTEPLAVHATGLQGDGQADLVNHGGKDKAICVYPSEHFAFWQRELELNMHAGAFGENFTVTEVNEASVCVGDIFFCNDLVVQISQPRQPCWKLARRWGQKNLAALVQNNGKTGWYFRVLEEGTLVAPANFELRERPQPDWTILRCNEVMHVQKKDLEQAQKLAAVPELSDSWQETLNKRIERLEAVS